MVPRGYSNAKEKIVEAASELFFRQGYQATTIDQVIEHSGVSRPTVYSHFKTKEEICLVYLKSKRREDLGKLRDYIRGCSNDEDRFLSVIRFVREAMTSTEYRGCGYFNMISEFPDHEHPIVKEARVYVDGFRDVIADVVKDLKSNNPKFKKLDEGHVADVYYVLVCGAIMASQEYQEVWPLDQAVTAVRNLLKG